jgi:hypothetical protein
MRNWLFLWVASLIVVATIASALARAQTKEAAGIISGDDIGFRVEGMNPAGDAVGTWVVRIDGRWVTATSRMSVQRP